MRRQELHENERPSALMMSYQAEMNRDKKKRKKPFSIEEFYLYNSGEDVDRVDPIYGAAANKLIQMKLFPNWALFAYKELVERADEASPPEELWLYSDHAIVLAPTFDEDVCRGMLIATEHASNKIIPMMTMDGRIIKVKIPDVKNKVIAEENCYLDCFR